MQPEDFPGEANEFIAEISQTLTFCPDGFLRRFLAFFGPYETFCYSDNDVVALTNWQVLFDLLDNYDLLHADEEYTTKGRFNYHNPDVIKTSFGEGALEEAITAGHFVARKSDKLVSGMRRAIKWIEANKDVCKAHDQTMLHLAAMLGDWNCLNLCKPPNNWLSSWAGDYKTPLKLIQSGQAGRKISHLHYSGYGPHSFKRAVDPLKLSYMGHVPRNKKMLKEYLREFSRLNSLEHLYKRAKRKLLG
ncbi:hypothetical protein [Coraliomargarita sinensis]|nr:hypothetical protein [Coraliomargarita sinensis]